MPTSITARVLGQRVRQLRTRRGLTQQDLAASDYSKSYISAIEQGKTRPSLEALQRIAARLEVPAGLLLDAEAQGFAPYDPEAVPRRVRRRRGARGGTGPTDPAQVELELARAEALAYTGRAVEALNLVLGLLPDDEVKEGTRPADPWQLQRIHSVAALAATRSGEGQAAIEHAEKGMQIANRQGDLAGAERMRNLLGLGYYMTDQPLLALEQHRAALEALQSNRVRDPNLKMQVLHNLAADYWTLHDNERARATYKEAIDLINDVVALEQQAAIFMEIATELGELHDYLPARTYATRAAGIYEGLDNAQLVARIENRYGDLLVDMGDLDTAEVYLARSLELAGTLHSDVDRALAQANLARFMMKQGKLAEAEEHAQQAVETARNKKAGGGEAGRGKNEMKLAADNARVLTKALAVAGEVATLRGNTEQADRNFSEAIRVLEANEAVGAGSDIYQRYAQVLSARGEHEQAAKYFERAYRAVTNQPK